MAGRHRCHRFGRGVRAGARRSVVFLSGRRRRPDHQDHRWLRCGFREGESGHQAEAYLFRQLPGIDHQGADRGEERRSARHVDPALDRHVHADRRGRDRAVRRSREDRRRPGVAQELLSGLHGEQPDRGQDVGHSVPAVDDRSVLQQGRLQGGRPRSEQAASRSLPTRRNAPMRSPSRRPRSPRSSKSRAARSRVA